MFYNRFISICEEYDVRPTPVLKELDISPGNLKRWENGASINADTLKKIADYFNVPVDYFLNDGEEAELDDKVISDARSETERIMMIARTHPDYIASILGGRELKESSLLRIATYLRCTPKYLTGKDINKKKPAEDNSPLTDKELVIDIMSRIPYSKDYKHLQVMISRIVIENLRRSGITEQELCSTGISTKKVRELFDSSTDNENILALTNSDLMRIVQEFGVSYDTMFTGV